jgi:rhodanese-related sulfurtransferase
MSRSIILLIVLFSLQYAGYSQKKSTDNRNSKTDELALEEYLLGFDYEARSNMRIGTAELVELMKQNNIQMIDIRFREEYAVWSVAGSINIPLNELPNRLNELDKNKLIITVCPHNDRANIARIFLITKGYNAKYYASGLLDLVNYLRGMNAKDYIETIR